jgi:hypothetical protein
MCVIGQPLHEVDEMKLDEFLVLYIVQPGIVLIAGVLYINVRSASERVAWTKKMLTLGVFCLVVWIFEDLGYELFWAFNIININKGHEVIGSGPTYLTYNGR